jgi:hypothetical protein
MTTGSFLKNEIARLPFGKLRNERKGEDCHARLRRARNGKRKLPSFWQVQYLLEIIQESILIIALIQSFLITVPIFLLFTRGILSLSALIFLPTTNAYLWVSFAMFKRLELTKNSPKTRTSSPEQD